MKRLIAILVLAAFSSTVRAGSDTNALELIAFKKVNRSPNAEAGIYNSRVVITLTLKNNTGKTVTAWKANMKVRNAFDEEILDTGLTSNDSNIKPGGIEKAPFVWDDNQFIDGEPYDNLSAVSEENMKIDISGIKVVTKP